MSKEGVMSEPGALCGPGQPDVSGPVLMPQTRYGLSVLKPALLVLLGWGGALQARAGTRRGMEGCSRGQDPQSGEGKG